MDKMLGLQRTIQRGGDVKSSSDERLQVRPHQHLPLSNLIDGDITLGIQPNKPEGKQTVGLFCRGEIARLFEYGRHPITSGRSMMFGRRRVPGSHYGPGWSLVV